MFPHTITIYNQYKDGSEEKYRRTVLSGVLWIDRKGANMRRHGADAEDGLQLLIPFSADTGRRYQKPQEFQRQPEGWTLKPGDTVLLGEHLREIERASEFSGLDDVMVVKAVDTRDFGGSMAHWEVTGR